MKKIILTFFLVLACSAFLFADECPTPATATATVTFKCKADVPTGGFQVSPTKRVEIAKGNLMYIISLNKWEIMEEQYFEVEHKPENVGDGYWRRDTVSLFGWATSGNPLSGDRYMPTETSLFGYYCDYGNLGQPDAGDWGIGSVCEWGQNVVDDQGRGGWRTLTDDEWYYLFFERETGVTIYSPRSGHNIENCRFVQATLLTDGTGRDSIDYDLTGYLLFPDGFVMPDDLGTDVIWDEANNTWTRYGTKCTTEGWRKLEEAGCVFLPAAGRRLHAEVMDTYGEASLGYYWTSTATSATNAYCLRFDSSTLNARYDYVRYEGLSVRLVRDMDE